MDLGDQSNKTNISGKKVEDNTNTHTVLTNSRDTSNNWTFATQGNYTKIDNMQAMKKELLLLRELLIRQEDTYRDDLQRHKKMLSNLQRSIEHSSEQEILLMKQMTDYNGENRKFQIVLEEYKSAVTKLLVENDKARIEHQEKKRSKQKEIQTVQDHLVNTQKAFEDLQLKSDSIKRVLHLESGNVFVLNEKFQECKLMINEMSENYNLLKTTAETNLESANEELATIKRNNQNQSSKLNALIKKSELRIRSLEGVLAQKAKENQALMTMCDDLIDNQENNDSENLKKYELSETFTKNS